MANNRHCMMANNRQYIVHTNVGTGSVGMAKSANKGMSKATNAVGFLNDVLLPSPIAACFMSIIA